MEGKLGNFLQYSEPCTQKIASSLPYDSIREWTPEEKAEIETKNKAYAKEQERKNFACVIVDIAERLVVTQNLQPEQAIDTAESLTKLAISFVKNWKMPEE